MLLPSSVLLLPLVLAGSWNDEFSRVCSKLKNSLPFRDGQVYKQCSFQPKHEGKIDVVGCFEPVRETMIACNQALPVIDGYGNVMIIINNETGIPEEEIDTCDWVPNETWDNEWQLRRGSRPMQAQLDFFDANPVCKANGLRLKFLDANNYKQCLFDTKKGFGIEIVACKAVDGRAPLAVGEERRDNLRNDVETCTRHGDDVIYEYRLMTEQEIIEKDDILALCIFNGFTNAFIHENTYKRCVSNGNGALGLSVVGCISQEQEGVVLPMNSRHESEDGVVEVCEETRDENGEIGVTLIRSANRRRDSQQESSQSTTALAAPSSTLSTSSTLVSIECDLNGLGVVFFDGNVAKKCVAAPGNTNGIVVETVGCRFGHMDEVVELGVTYVFWDDKFRCVMNEDGGKKETADENEHVPMELTIPRHQELPDCTLNGQVVELHKRVIVGGLFEFRCQKVPRRHKHSRPSTTTELHFLGCINPEAKGAKRWKNNSGFSRVLITNFILILHPEASLAPEGMTSKLRFDKFYRCQES